ncbi:MAG TPA: ubiquinol-cytochrome C chaperone family protein [Rhizomicrobium sp.]
MLNLLKARTARRQFVARLQDQLVARAREKVFFREFAVPDTMDGRFDLTVLHACLVLERLKAAAMDDVAQALTDEIFVSFDDALREQGTGDMGMGRRMKAMASAFHGRLKAYGEARNIPALAAALTRNIFRGADVDAAALAHYVLAAREALAACAVEQGDLDFGPLPGTS